MELWLWLVIIGQLFMAISAIVDKYVITSKHVALRPLSYTFWISILSSGSVVLFLFSWVPIPWEGLDIPSFSRIHAPSLTIFALALTAGYAFFTALLSFFNALKQSDASDVVPVVGGLNAFFTLGLSYLFLDAPISHNFLWGFALLVAGTLVVSHFRFTRRTILSVVHAGLMYGVHYIALKELFNVTNFDTAFFWSRIAIVFVALSMLLIPEYYDNIISHTRKVRSHDGALVLGNKILAGIASFLLLKAVEHGNVAMVQALGGIQFLFLLLISMFCCRYAIWNDTGEKLTYRDVLHKVLAVPLIVLGFYFLFA